VATPLPPKGRKAAPKARCPPNGRGQRAAIPLWERRTGAYPVANRHEGAALAKTGRPSAKSTGDLSGKTLQPAVESKAPPPALGRSQQRARPSKSTPAPPAAHESHCTMFSAAAEARHGWPAAVAAARRATLENAGGPVPDSSSLTGGTSQPAGPKLALLHFLKRLRLSCTATVQTNRRERALRCTRQNPAPKTKRSRADDCPFGARHVDQTVGGKPPAFLALALTAALLVFLAGVCGLGFTVCLLTDGAERLPRIFGSRDTNFRRHRQLPTDQRKKGARRP